MLSENHVKHVCAIGQGSRECRYLERGFEHTNSRYIYLCRKKEPKVKEMIDGYVEDYINDCKKKGINIHENQYPIGDNCPGYYSFLTIEQGYDVDD